MDKFIAYCGLDCSKCEARIATINNDDNLRKKVAKEWSEMNQVEILPSMINCEGCRLDGVKSVFCDRLCEIKKCASNNKFDTCGDCKELLNCGTIKMIIDHNDNALNNLKN